MVSCAFASRLLSPSNATMKSFEVIPVEVWQHIISTALYIPGYMNLDEEGLSEFTLNELFVNIQPDDRTRLNQTRSNLRLVCRSWSVFVDTAPYSVIDVGKRNQQGPVGEAAHLVHQAYRINCMDIHRLEQYCDLGGHFKARILIIDLPTEGLLHYSANQFISFFRNLVSIKISTVSVYYDASPSEAITCELLGQLPLLRHLFITTLSNRIYTTMEFPRLVRLNFQSDDFPWLAVDDFSFDRWKLENLTHLVIAPVFTKAIMTILMDGLQHFGRRLKSLLMGGQRKVQYPLPNPVIPPDIWRHCPNLQEIGWDPGSVNGNSVCPPFDHPIHSFTLMPPWDQPNRIVLHQGHDLILSMIGLKGRSRWMNLRVIVLPYFSSSSLSNSKWLNGFSAHFEKNRIHMEDHTGNMLCPLASKP